MFWGRVTFGSVFLVVDDEDVDAFRQKQHTLKTVNWFSEKIILFCRVVCPHYSGQICCHVVLFSLLVAYIEILNEATTWNRPGFFLFVCFLALFSHTNLHGKIALTRALKRKPLLSLQLPLVVFVENYRQMCRARFQWIDLQREFPVYVNETTPVKSGLFEIPN